MFSVPVRGAADPSGATLKVTTPLPEPPEATVNHAASLVAVHAQPGAARISAVAFTPPGPTLIKEFANANPQLPACWTRKECPPMVKVPVLVFKDVLDATENPTAPLAAPVLPDVTVNHAASLIAVQLQPLGAVTATVPSPSPAPKL